MAEGRVLDRTMMDCMLLPKRMLGRLLYVKVWIGEGGGMSDHFFGGGSAESGWWTDSNNGGVLGGYRV